MRTQRQLYPCGDFRTYSSSCKVFEEGASHLFQEELDELSGKIDKYTWTRLFFDWKKSHGEFGKKQKLRKNWSTIPEAEASPFLQQASKNAEKLLPPNPKAKAIAGAILKEKSYIMELDGRQNLYLSIEADSFPNPNDMQLLRKDHILLLERKIWMVLAGVKAKLKLPFFQEHAVDLYIFPIEEEPSRGRVRIEVFLKSYVRLGDTKSLNPADPTTKDNYRSLSKGIFADFKSHLADTKEVILKYGDILQNPKVGQPKYCRDLRDKSSVVGTHPKRKADGPMDPDKKTGMVGRQNMFFELWVGFCRGCYCTELLEAGWCYTCCVGGAGGRQRICSRGRTVRKTIRIELSCRTRGNIL